MDNNSCIVYCIASPVNAVLVLHVIGEVNAGVVVTESSHILHLILTQCKQDIPLLIFHVHDIKHGLNALQQYSTYSYCLCYFG